MGGTGRDMEMGRGRGRDSEGEWMNGAAICAH